MMYSVSSELYLEVAARLAEAIGGGSYFSGSLTFPFGDMECRLTASVIVYRRRAWVFQKISVKCSNQPNRPLRSAPPQRFS